MWPHIGGRHVRCELPARAGLGLKPQHYQEILETSPQIGFFEIHAENYMGDGGPPHRYLEAIRSRYPLSIHGSGSRSAGANASTGTISGDSRDSSSATNQSPSRST
jgi:uncharacterized protein (UPF0276 family)